MLVQWQEPVFWGGKKGMNRDEKNTLFYDLKYFSTYAMF